MSLPPGFIRVTRWRPCPICGRPDWCLLAIDGTKAVCARTISDRPFGDAGYIHTLGKPVKIPIRRPIHSPPKRIDWNYMALKFWEDIDDKTVRETAESLGVSDESLERLRMGWCAEHEALSFPMYDMPSNAVGIRLRTANGLKFAVTGSRNALFIPNNLKGDGFMLIVEGPTDTAAALDLGFDAIGRPSCSAAVEMTVRVIDTIGCRDVVILANYDDPKRRPDGGVFYPGQDGAKKLADALAAVPKRNVRVVYPLKGKDVRQWKAISATSAGVLATIRNTALWPMQITGGST